MSRRKRGVYAYHYRMACGCRGDEFDYKGDPVCKICVCSEPEKARTVVEYIGEPKMKAKPEAREDLRQRGFQF